ncbi:MAG TPA: nucleoside-diphosphate sugar epimerase/dehydratase [Bacillota bacterium]|nr:nucleoside-diphosphate sugar epimerase/dehydratase [Bacillota bacterium]
MRRKLISFTLMLIDASIVAVVAYLALYIRFEGKIELRFLILLHRYIFVFIPIELMTFYLFGLYKRMWRYASVGELIGITAAVSVGSVLTFVASLALGALLPKSFYITAWFLNILFIGACRMCIRVTAEIRPISENGQSRVLIVGAGNTGSMVAREIQQRHQQTKRIVGFADDSRAKEGQMLLGFKVLGSRKDLKRLVEDYQVDEIIIAIPSLTGPQLTQIVRDCRQTGCQVKIVPAMEELINGKPAVEQLREVNLEDLLRRDPVRLDLAKLAGYLQSKRVIVTGAGGSIGSELCRQIVRFQPSAVILLGKGENSIYEIEQELAVKYPDLNIEPVIADVRDEKRIRSIFARTRPEVVFHAAAHKHVPLMELQPEEAVQNNIFGTKNVAEAAHIYNAEIFVMVSTDKAVNPTSVMGTTKRVAEQVIQSIGMVSKTKFVAVRFGNVLGSRGSVVPLFKKQIAAGGPVTVTHPEMKRYFMTIPEAVQLVLQAGSMAKGGEVFVLDMGEPVRIYDMACSLIELAGLRPDKDIEIKFTGLRPGEKLFEEILSAEEGTSATNHEKIFIANLQSINLEKLERGLFFLQHCYVPQEIRRTLAELVPTYTGYNNEATDGNGQVETESNNTVSNIRGLVVRIK